MRWAVSAGWFCAVPPCMLCNCLSPVQLGLLSVRWAGVRGLAVRCAPICDAPFCDASCHAGPSILRTAQQLWR